MYLDKRPRLKGLASAQSDIVASNAILVARQTVISVMQSAGVSNAAAIQAAETAASNAMMAALNGTTDQTAANTIAVQVGTQAANAAIAALTPTPTPTPTPSGPTAQQIYQQAAGLASSMIDSGMSNQPFAAVVQAKQQANGALQQAIIGNNITSWPQAQMLVNQIVPAAIQGALTIGQTPTPTPTPTPAPTPTPTPTPTPVVSGLSVAQIAALAAISASNAAKQLVANVGLSSAAQQQAGTTAGQNTQNAIVGANVNDPQAAAQIAAQQAQLAANAVIAAAAQQAQQTAQQLTQQSQQQAAAGNSTGAQTSAQQAAQASQAAAQLTQSQYLQPYGGGSTGSGGDPGYVTPPPIDQQVSDAGLVMRSPIVLGALAVAAYLIFGKKH